MAKKIKFNLICDGYPVRTLEDLQEHFVIDDVLEYYQGTDRLLLRWLELRDYQEELAKVNAITTTDPLEIVKALAKVFVVDIDDDVIDHYFRFETERKERYNRNKEAAKTDLSVHAVLENYRLGYLRQINNLKSQDKKIRDFAIERLSSDYKWAFEMDFNNVFKQILSQSNLFPILALISNSQTRKLMLDKNNKMPDGLDKLLSKKLKGISFSESGYSVKHEIIKREGSKDLEVEGSWCLVVKKSSDLQVSSINETNWTEAYDENVIGQLFNGLKVKKNQSWEKSFIEYVSL